MDKGPSDGVLVSKSRPRVIHPHERETPKLVGGIGIDVWDLEKRRHALQPGTAGSLVERSQGVDIPNVGVDVWKGEEEVEDVGALLQSSNVEWSVRVGRGESVEVCEIEVEDGLCCVDIIYRSSVAQRLGQDTSHE